ncbi:hypothetical protein AB0O52_16580 [Arthrobacter sp. NPDC080073]|uniref:hypothetical protein n=1 Tax=Arthrobacter sp. NPDC080073 TaxID=3155919 RepID=UPI003419CBBE
MADRDRISEYRERMREQSSEASQQAAAVAAAERHLDDQEYIEAVSAPWDE